MWFLSLCGRWIILALLTGAARGQAQCYVTTAAPACVQLERLRPFVVTCTLVCGTSVPVSYFRLRLLSIDAYFECGHRGRYDAGPRFRSINWTCSVSQPRPSGGNGPGSAGLAGVVVSATYRLQWTDGDAPSERMFSDLLCSSVWTDMTVQPDDGGRPKESRDPLELRLPNCNKGDSSGGSDGGSSDSGDDHTLLLVVISGAVGLCCVAIIAWAICRCDKSIMVARLRCGSSFGGTGRQPSRVTSRPSSFRTLVRSAHDIRSAATGRRGVTADGGVPWDPRYAPQFGEKQQQQQQYHQHQQQQPPPPPPPSHWTIATGGEAGAAAPETIGTSEDWWVWSNSAPTSGAEPGAPQAAAAAAAAAHRPPPPIVTSIAMPAAVPSAKVAHGAIQPPPPPPPPAPTATSKVAPAVATAPGAPQAPPPLPSSPKTAESPQADVVRRADAAGPGEAAAIVAAGCAQGEGEATRGELGGGGAAKAEAGSSSSATSSSWTSSASASTGASTPPSAGASSKKETLVTVFVPSRRSFALRSRAMSPSAAAATAKATARMLQKASRQSMARASRVARSTADFMAKNFRVG